MEDLVVDKKELLNTLERIDNSLNCRFERDASLYISNQESQEIKEAIRNNLWQKLEGLLLTNKISNEILIIEIIKNGWIIDEDISWNDINKYIKPVFEKSDKEIFVRNASKITKNEIYVPYKIKKIINMEYYKKVDIKICKNIILNGDSKIYNSQIMKVCVFRILEEIEDPLELYYKIQELLESDISIHFKRGINYFIDNIYEYKDEEFIRSLSEKILSDELDGNYEESEKREFWGNIYTKLGDVASFVSLEYLEEFKFFDLHDKWLINNILISKSIINRINMSKERNTIINKLIKIFRDTDCLPVKKYISYNMKKIKDEKLKHDIIDNLLSVNKLELIENILLEEKEGNKEEKVIKDIFSVIEEINKHTLNPVGQLRYIDSSIDVKYRSKILDELITMLDIEEIQAFFLEIIKTNYRKDANRNCERIIEYLKETNNLDFYEKFIEVIIEKKYSFSAVKNFIKERDFELFTKLFTKKY
ncbi:hypothetical protein P5F43_15520 [Clostridium perfringens]|nr:hypothetical protein [Clostridium perfringens]